MIDALLFWFWSACAVVFAYMTITTRSGDDLQLFLAFLSFIILAKLWRKG